MRKPVPSFAEQIKAAKGLPKRMRPKIDECPARPPSPTFAANSITIEIPMPPAGTHPNARVGFRKKARLVKQQREEAAIAALGALSAMGSLADRPNWTSATIHATFYKPGSQAKVGDASNYNAWLKASEDGLQDAQIVANDRGFVWLSPSQVVGLEAGTTAKVRLVITKN